VKQTETKCMEFLEWGEVWNTNLLKFVIVVNNSTSSLFMLMPKLSKVMCCSRSWKQTCQHMETKLEVCGYHPKHGTFLSTTKRGWDLLT